MLLHHRQTEIHLPATNPMIRGASPLSHSCLKILQETWHSCVIRRGHRPFTFPDLTTCDLYLWDSTKVKMFKTNPRTLEELSNNIRREFSTISGQELQRVNNVHCRYNESTGVRRAKFPASGVALACFYVIRTAIPSPTFKSPETRPMT
jgi:hypothetical protein